MTSTRRSNLHSDVNTHPDDSILLAYLRGQKLETRSSVIQHIESEKCPVCFQKLNELEQVTNVLEVLGETRLHQYYPELTVEGTYARIEGAAHQRISAKTAMHDAKYRQRPRKSAVRLISVPVAFGLAILFTMAMLVFASLSGRAFNPLLSNGGTSSRPNILTVVVPPHSTSTQHPNVVATDVASPKGTSQAKVPHITVCSTRANIARLQMVICGFNFDSMHRAMLFFYLPGKVPFWRHNIPVDKHGKFHVEWNIADCGNMPTYIFGFEAIGSKLIRVRLHITSFGACVEPLTPVANPSRLSPKFGI